MDYKEVFSNVLQVALGKQTMFNTIREKRLGHS